jgi:hypothetical protein
MPDPRRWHRGDLEELPLEFLPRKALSRDVPPDELLPTLDAFLRFLENLADFGVRRTWQCCDASSAT